MMREAKTSELVLRINKKILLMHYLYQLIFLGLMSQTIYLEERREKRFKRKYKKTASIIYLKDLEQMKQMDLKLQSKSEIVKFR